MRVGDVMRAQAPVEERSVKSLVLPQREVPVPALPSSVIEPVWDQFAALLPEHVDTHLWGCHNPRISDRIVFDKLIQVLLLGASYERIADSTCSATSIRNRRDEWIAAGIFTQLEQICLEAYDRIVGLDLGDVTVDGCIVKAPCGGEAPARTAMTLPCCDPRWKNWPPSMKAWASGCPKTSPSTSMPVTTRARPAICSASSDAQA